MLINTHLIIGQYCFNLCNEKYDLMLNKRQFLYGCIEPDLHKRKNKINHTYTVSKEKMAEYKEAIENGDMTIDEISFTLGRIAHYIADCFCKYHLEEYYGKDMGKHFMYEITLHKKLKNILRYREEIFENVLEDLRKDRDYLEELTLNREEYVSLDEDCINDIYFTIKTTCHLLYMTQVYFGKLVIA